MFKLVSDFKAAGDQPEAIDALSAGIKAGTPYQTLQGVTGSGKTFTLANAISRFEKPVLVLSHNKTLAAQLYSEFKSFFPENAVEYFVSYYDYYLPEAYIPQTDTYIAKDASINEGIERLRLSTTSSLMERRDVIVIASVSCIYGLGSPDDYEWMSVCMEKGATMDRNEFLRKLVAIQYDRNDTAPGPGEFRVRGDSVDVFLPQRDEFVRVSFWGDEIESVSSHETVSGRLKAKKDKAVFFPCKHFVMPQEKIEKALESIKKEMLERVRHFEKNGLLVEAQRLFQRVNSDIEMMREIGYCSGIENYSMHLSNRMPGSRPFCLFDFFPEDFITVVDESHVTISQLGAMYKADRSRKQTLVDHGFRLPSALDNRPLMFDEFMSLIKETIFVSATPGSFELEKCGGEAVQQVVRPTGLLDPEIIIKPLEGQIDDVMNEIRKATARGERTIVTTLTKKSSERLSDYLCDLGMKVRYLHSEIDALERAKILNELRKGDFDCLVGINLLREGIDLPEVALVAILDADKEGFLRSERSLIQVAGRAARNVNGRVILYADRITDSIKKLVDVTEKRRICQTAYNKKHKITPKTIKKEVKQTICDIISESLSFAPKAKASAQGTESSSIEELVRELEKEMYEAADSLEFERAADLRDKIKKISTEMNFQ
ncbi:MAG: excinuclease ABC subunit B [Lentisphaerae bacterium GWF2_45_14]|nr:MAG: excinuclease ABC subunit B [Lentisphaerae bacterium GWF2_45_14]